MDNYACITESNRFPQFANFPEEYSNLCGDKLTTFDDQEKMFKKFYDDVTMPMAMYDDREKYKQDISKSMGKDRSKKLDHPSKEFMLTGGLRQVTIGQQFMNKVINSNSNSCTCSGCKTKMKCTAMWKEMNKKDDLVVSPSEQWNVLNVENLNNQ